LSILDSFGKIKRKGREEREKKKVPLPPKKSLGITTIYQKVFFAYFRAGWATQSVS